MILIIDNYDSFVFNLSRYIIRLGQATQVLRNDRITINEIIQLQPSHIILSPGPCTPNEAGICLDLVKHFSGIIPIFGVCLGHQAIGQAHGCKIIKAKRPMHGKASQIQHTTNGIFENIPQPMTVGRYHSLIIDKNSVSNDIEVIAESKEREIMAIKHKEHLTFGVQFHPESIMTEHGMTLLENFIRLSKEHTTRVVSNEHTLI